jgi:hypothetical protein
MKFATDRPYADPEKAARKLVEIANLINWPFLSEHAGSPTEYKAGLELAIASGWLWLHESGTYVKFTQTGAELPRGRRLVTLEDAGYITELTKAEHAAPEWQDAMEALMLVATRGGPTMLARIGVMRALHRNVERVFTDRKDTHWGKRKLKRDE